MIPHSCAVEASTARRPSTTTRLRSASTSCRPLGGSWGESVGPNGPARPSLSTLRLVSSKTSSWLQSSPVVPMCHDHEQSGSGSPWASAHLLSDIPGLDRLVVHGHVVLASSFFSQDLVRPLLCFRTSVSVTQSPVSL
ncbi:hypothetical protein B0H67DRAFT_75639 [Lasiosphaeris hirsuta]|uniref:Uncharacterized protein n=1 Tax=Lasiosphaeris hirsuta TaxID=260670 RepID=A0AA40BCA5_9PEZI|nr:hypothetical protein B0H67DRAFT_75639 [Lasiosphaeris hirsuta]